jgi:hypothetical protein
MRDTGTKQLENCRIERTKNTTALYKCRAERSLRIGNITSLIDVRDDFIRPPHGTDNDDVAIKYRK